MKRLSQAAAIFLVMFIGPMALAAQTHVHPDDLAQLREAWNSATAYMRAGAPRRALPLLEKLVSLAPDDPKVRLELALAYYLIHDDEKARFHFSRSLGADLDDRLRQEVLHYLRMIEERRNLKVSLSFAIVPQSNAAKRTSSKTINLGGLDFLLNETAEPGTSADFRARVTYSLPLARDLSSRISLAAFGSVFEESGWNDYSLKTEAGLVLRNDLEREWNGGVYAIRRWLADKAFSNERGVFGSFAVLLRSSVQLSLRGELAQRLTPEIPERDGSVLRLSGLAVRSLSSRTSLQARASASFVDAHSDAESTETYALGVGASHLFGRGWLILAQTDLSREHRLGDAPLFGVRRREWHHSSRIQILNRNMQRLGYTPMLELGHERRRANIPMFSYENTSVSLGLTREF